MKKLKFIILSSFLFIMLFSHVSYASDITTSTDWTVSSDDRVPGSNKFARQDNYRIELSSVGSSVITPRYCAYLYDDSSVEIWSNVPFNVYYERFISDNADDPFRFYSSDSYSVTSRNYFNFYQELFAYEYNRQLGCIAFSSRDDVIRYLNDGSTDGAVFEPTPLFSPYSGLEFENFSFNYDSTRQDFYINRAIKNESDFENIKLVIDTKYFNTCVSFPDGLNPISFVSNTYSFTRDYNGHSSDGSYSSKDSFNVYKISDLESIAEFLRTGPFAFQRIFATQPFTIGSDSYINQTSKIQFVFSLFATRDGQQIKGKQYSYTYDFLNGNGYYSQNTPSDDGYTSGQPVFIPSNGSADGSVNGNITVSGDIHIVTDSSDGPNITIEDDDYTRWTLINNIKSGYELLDNTDTGAKGDGLIAMFNNLMGGIDSDIPLMFGFGISSVIVIAILRSFLRR